MHTDIYRIVFASATDEPYLLPLVGIKSEPLSHPAHRLFIIPTEVSSAIVRGEEGGETVMCGTSLSEILKC
jgi:hypothetical protein